MKPLTTGQVAKFKELYRQHFGEDISGEVAREKGERLVELIRLIRKPPKPTTDKPTN